MIRRFQTLSKRILQTYRSSKRSIGHQVETQSGASPVWSWNEWDPLEEIIVGLPDNAAIPHLMLEVQACVEPEKWDFYRKFGGKTWETAMGKDEWRKIIADINELVFVLQQEGVIVKRPEPFEFCKSVKTPDFETTGFYCAMPRDNILIIGDEIIEAPMTWRSRYFEFKCYRSLILDYWRRGAKWTMAPKPEYTGKLFDPKYNDNGNSNYDSFVTTEYEPCFDAADFIRAGRDVFAQRSQVTNISGIEWVRRHLKPVGINVHQLSFQDPRPMHIDATLNIPKPGYVFQNPDRPCQEIQFFKSHGWEVYDAPMPKLSNDNQLWLGSKWLSMNTLMLDQNRVLVEKEETGIQNLYRKIGVEPILVSMKHAYAIGGGIHCWTCDVRRKGQLENYF